MLLIKNKPLRLLAGTIETFNLLTLKLLLRNRKNWHRYAGKVFREYMSLVEKDRWRSAQIEDLVSGTPGLRVTLEHLDGEGIYAPIDEAG